MELSFARWQYYDIYKDQISPPPGPYRTRLGGHKVIRDKLGHPSENIHQAVLANLFVLRVDSWRFDGDFYLLVFEESIDRLCLCTKCQGHSVLSGH